MTTQATDRLAGTWRLGPADDFMGTRRGFTLATTIDRIGYGVSWNADLPKGSRALPNDVELEFMRAA